MSRLFEGAVKNWKYVLSLLIIGLIFLLWQYYYQLSFIPDNWQLALVRALGFAGATFFAIALLSSSMFKFWPQYAKYWTARRMFGVMGFTFIFLHFLTTTMFFYDGNPMLLYFPLNPFENLLIFGLAAYPIFFLMFLTSTDWAYEKMGPPRWKALHRLVYFAFMFSVFHFLLINPPALKNLSGYLLLLVTFLALLGELYWFIKMAIQKGFRGLGVKIGFLIILFWLALIYLAYPMLTNAFGIIFS